MIGLDTSHCVAFTQAMNDEKAVGYVPGAQVAAAYPSFSKDIESSVNRVEGYKNTLAEKYGVKMVASIRELVEQVDAILLESVDGRRHLPELREVVEAIRQRNAAAAASASKTLPVFIDKPFAASLADAKEMVRIVRENKIPCFSSSALRYEANLQKFLAEKDKLGKVQGCDAYSPAHLEKTNPGFFWYGIHGTEILYTIMGRGCRTVRCASTPAGDVAVGVWADGRIGTMRGIREGKNGYGAVVICEKGIRSVEYDGKVSFYPRLVGEIVKFFQTGQPPVPLEDTLEICAFIDAALRSSQEKCGDVPLATE